MYFQGVWKEKIRRGGGWGGHSGNSVKPKEVYCQKKKMDNDNLSEISVELKAEMHGLHLET